MTETLDIHGHQLVFNKNKGKAIIEIDLGTDTQECVLIDIFSVDDKDYIALLSIESTDIFLFRYNDSFDDEDSNIDLTMIKDEDEVDEVFHLFSHYWTDDKIDELLDGYSEEGSKL